MKKVLGWCGLFVTAACLPIDIYAMLNTDYVLQHHGYLKAALFGNIMFDLCVVWLLVGLVVGGKRR